MHDAVRVSQLRVGLEVPDDQVVYLSPLSDPVGIQFFNIDRGEFSHELGGRAALAATLSQAQRKPSVQGLELRAPRVGQGCERCVRALAHRQPLHDLGFTKVGSCISTLRLERRLPLKE